jgi:hypothetical protein
MSEKKFQSICDIIFLGISSVFVSLIYQITQIFLF